MSFQTCKQLFLLLNIKEDILKNVDNQTFLLLSTNNGSWNGLVTSILQNIIVCASQKKEQLTSLELIK